MQTVGGCRGGVEQQVGVSSVEVSMKALGDRLQVHVLDAPHLQTSLLPCGLKLLMGHHDASERGEGVSMEGEGVRDRGGESAK